MKFSATFFDLDGTLIDSLPDIADSVNRTLAHKGFPSHPLKAFKYHVGDGVFELFRRALPPDQSGDETLVKECVEIYRKDYDWNWHTKTKLFDGVAKLLDYAILKGMKLAVISNKPDEFTRKCVEHFMAGWPIAQTIGASKAFPHKPDPAMALHVCELMKLDPASVFYVGDTATDMKTAVNAGFYPLGALWGYRTREELLTSGARALAERPADVIAALEKF